MPEGSVSWLSFAPVKGLGLVSVEEIELGAHGVAENRRFYVVDEDGRYFDGVRHGPLVQVRPAWEPEPNRLALHFPDGSLAEGEVALGEPLGEDGHGEPGDRLVEGTWSEALSRFAGRPLRLVRSARAGAGLRRAGPVSLLARASLEELARRSNAAEPLDERRFRMLVGVDGIAPHEEDEWIGRVVRLGGATVRIGGQVDRCAVPTQDPDTGVPDFPTLRAIKDYRGLRDGRAIDFGVYGQVAEPGRVRLGDEVVPL